MSYAHILISGLVEKANNAETERNNKKKILEEAENDLTKAKNNLNIRKTKFKVRVTEIIFCTLKLHEKNYEFLP